MKSTKAVRSLPTTEPGVPVICTAAPHRFRDMVVQMDPDLLLRKFGGHSIKNLHSDSQLSDIFAERMPMNTSSRVISGVKSGLCLRICSSIVVPFA